MRWYVVHAYSGYEKKVALALQDRVKLHRLDDRFGEIMVPTEEVVEMRDGQKRTSERMFFPGYVLVQMELDDQTWHLVKETPRVLGFIGGTKNNPKPISETEANKILQQQEEGIQPSSQITAFEPGEMIRVIDGPFNDFSGVVEEIDQEKSKVKVAVMIFGRSTPVELDFTQIERS